MHIYTCYYVFSGRSRPLYADLYMFLRIFQRQKCDRTGGWIWINSFLDGLKAVLGGALLRLIETKIDRIRGGFETRGRRIMIILAKT